MKIFILQAAIVLLMYTLQTSLANFINFNGITVNLMLLLTGSVAFLRGWKYGLATGFILGLLQDLTSGSFFGCAIFSYMTIGILFGRFSTHIYKEQFIFPVLSAPVAALMHFFIMFGFIYLLGYNLNATHFFKDVLLPMMIYQFIFAWFVHKIVFTYDKFEKEYFA